MRSGSCSPPATGAGLTELLGYARGCAARRAYVLPAGAGHRCFSARYRRGDDSRADHAAACVMKCPMARPCRFWNLRNDPANPPTSAPTSSSNAIRTRALSSVQKGRSCAKLARRHAKEIEAMLDEKVFLDLWVKVEPRWRRDENALKRLGYSSN